MLILNITLKFQCQTYNEHMEPLLINFPLWSSLKSAIEDFRVKISCRLSVR